MKTRWKSCSFLDAIGRHLFSRLTKSDCLENHAVKVSSKGWEMTTKLMHDLIAQRKIQRRASDATVHERIHKLHEYLSEDLSNQLPSSLSRFPDQFPRLVFCTSTMYMAARWSLCNSLLWLIQHMLTHLFSMKATISFWRIFCTWLHHNVGLSILQQSTD